VDDQTKAAEEIAKTVGKGIDAGREVGSFLAKYIGGTVEQAMGIIEDRLKYVRWERKIRLLQKVNELLAQMGRSATIRPVPLNIAVPLVEYGSLQEDDSLQDIWAQLLANAADATSGVEVRRAFLTILNDLSPLDARNLKKIYEVSDPMSHKGIATTGLPNKAFAKLPEGDPRMLGLDPNIEVSIRNLVRLGLAEPIPLAPLSQGGTAVTVVHRTELGREFVRACTRI
jgi:hypothetical protein